MSSCRSPWRPSFHRATTARTSGWRCVCGHAPLFLPPALFFFFLFPPRPIPYFKSPPPQKKNNTQDDVLLPVLVYIHGGGLVEGGAVGLPLWDVAGADPTGTGGGPTVVVSLHYRLGAYFTIHRLIVAPPLLWIHLIITSSLSITHGRTGMHGFLALEDLSAEAQALGRGRTSGNYGLMDQQAALTWVQVRKKIPIQLGLFCRACVRSISTSHTQRPPPATFLLHLPPPTTDKGSHPCLWRRPRPGDSHRSIQRGHERPRPSRLPGLQRALSGPCTLPSFVRSSVHSEGGNQLLLFPPAILPINKRHIHTHQKTPPKNQLMK